MRIVGQLGREDWIEAGLEILARGGPAALRVGAAAQRLAVTRGSFYWHFRDRSAWRDALLAYWEHLCFAALVRAGRGRPRRGPGSAMIDPAAMEGAFRIWALDDAQVARVVARVEAERRLGLAGVAARCPRAA